MDSQIDSTFIKTVKKCPPGRVLGEVLRTLFKIIDIWSPPNPQNWAIAWEGARFSWMAMPLKSFPKCFKQMSILVPLRIQMLPKSLPGRSCDAHKKRALFLLTFMVKKVSKNGAQNKIAGCFSGSGPRLRQNVPKRDKKWSPRGRTRSQMVTKLMTRSIKISTNLIQNT